MKKFVHFFIYGLLIMWGNNIKGQSIYEVIDSTDIAIATRCEFIRDYFSTYGGESKSFWHPKYHNKNDYNYAIFIDAVSRNFSPKDLRANNKLMISELEILNDTLSYCKIEISTNEGHHYLTHKYYIVDVNGELFLDNCLPYELERFRFITTENLDFYVSPYHVVDEQAYTAASDAIDSLYRALQPRAKKEKFRIFMCSNIEEMNILSNMTKYYGYVGGFANMEENYAVYTYNTPMHKHEFVHLILGKSRGQGFILGEGIPTLYGGISPLISYDDGKEQIREGYKNSRYDFEKLYRREVANARDNTPSYTTAAIVCEYIRSNFGIEKLIELYYDPNINDENLLGELSKLRKITEPNLVKEIEKIILEE